MTNRLHYGTTAKIFHWLIVALLFAQYPIGMPDIHRGMKPGDAMTLHISFGILILVLIVLRFFWRITHSVAPETSLPPWQRLTSEAVHWLLYALVFAATVTGWLFASFRGWPVSFFHLTQLPMLASESASAARTIDGWHQAAGWALLVVIAVHVLAAMAHIFISIALCSECCPDDPILTSMSGCGTYAKCRRTLKMSAYGGIVLQKSQNALRLICRKKTKQVTIADQCVLKRATEAACEFTASWPGPPHDYWIAVPTGRRN